MGRAVEKHSYKSRTRNIESPDRGEGNLPGRAEVLVIQPPHNRDQLYPQRRKGLRRSRISTVIPRSSVPAIGGRKENPCSCLPRISIAASAKSHLGKKASMSGSGKSSSCLRNPEMPLLQLDHALRQGHAGQSDNRWICCGTSAKGD